MARARKPKPELIEKERQVVELRRAGCTWDDVARQVGYADGNSALHAYERAIKRTLRTAGVDEMRALEGERLDRMQRAAWGKAITGDLPAIHTVIRVMERRAKLFGLDAPIQVGVTVEHLDTNSIDAEVARLAAMLKPELAPEKSVGGGSFDFSDFSSTIPANSDHHTSATPQILLHARCLQ
jgi:hypothetical protein